MPLRIEKRDILHSGCQCIVCPTDGRYSGSGGVDGQIHAAAGQELASACAVLSPLGVGEAAVTPGFSLPCKYVIHTRGPVWKGGIFGEEAKLREAYRTSLEAMKSVCADSAAFPLISSGTFGFPRDRVLRIAQKAISEWLLESDTDPDVVLCVPDPGTFTISRRESLEEFLSPRENLIGCASVLSLEECCADTMSMVSSRAPGRGKAGKVKSAVPQSLSEWIGRRDDSFAVMLLKLIDKKGMKDAECYKKANVSRKTFWKINNDPAYSPSKPTVLAFAVALELTLEETQTLLRTVGMTLSHSNTFDMILEYYISNGIYDVFEINEALFQYDQLNLG